MRTVSNNYSPIHDLDAPPGPTPQPQPQPDTALPVANGERDVVEDEFNLPPSYDESNRMNPLTVVR
jgi:hypothetical protein